MERSRTTTNLTDDSRISLCLLSALALGLRTTNGYKQEGLRRPTMSPCYQVFAMQLIQILIAE